MMSSTYPIPQGDPANGASASPLGKVLTAVFALIAMTALAAVVLLPEYAELTDLKAREAAFAHQLACEQRLARYNDRLIRGLRSDPVLRAREAMRRHNYTPVGYRTVPLPGRSEATVPQRIGADSLAVPQPAPDVFARAGRWLDDPFTRSSLVLVSLGMLAVMLAMFPSTAPDE